MHEVCFQRWSATVGKVYRSGTSGIGWLVNTLRPDLAYTFSRLGSHLSQPTVSARQALKQALRYIKGTKPYKLSMKLRVDQGPTDIYEMIVDSGHGSNAELNNKRKSQTGEIATPNDVPTKWKSKTQAIIATSSTEAEIYAAFVATQDFMHLPYVTQELGLEDFPSPFPLQIDNVACIIFMDNSSRVSRLKHIDLRQRWVKQMRDNSIVSPTKVGTDDNLLDLLTNPLTKAKLEQFCNTIFNTSSKLQCIVLAGCPSPTTFKRARYWSDIVWRRCINNCESIQLV